MADLDRAVCWAVGIAADDSHGYDQPGREGRDFDCSSLVCRALKAAGFPMPTPSFSTRSMGAWLEAHGWSWHAGTGGVRRGDVLWMHGHTAMAESGQRFVEAQLNERGGISGGAQGDQTGREIVAGQPMSKYRWSGYWRYNGIQTEEEEVTDEDIQKIADRVVNYMLNGVQLRDRVIGTDGAANAARDQLTRTDDPTGRGTVANLYERVAHTGAKAAKCEEQLTRTDDPTGRGTQADLYTRVCFVGQKLDKLTEDVAALKAAVEEGK